MKRILKYLIGALGGVGVFLFAIGVSDAQIRAIVLVMCAFILMGGGILMISTFDD